MLGGQRLHASGSPCLQTMTAGLREPKPREAQARRHQPGSAKAPDGWQAGHLAGGPSCQLARALWQHGAACGRPQGQQQAPQAWQAQAQAQGLAPRRLWTAARLQCALAMTGAPAGRTRCEGAAVQAADGGWC